MPDKSSINPATGKAYAINPSSGVWDDNYWANTVEPQLKAQYGSSGGGIDTANVPAFNQPTIDLPKIYQGLYDASGVSNTEKQLVDTQAKTNAAISAIKDNPYLSEATMGGRIGKLTDKSNADITNLKNDIATKKADIETQLNLQTKQFDINSQQAKQAFDQFQSLLSAGALDNASGQDIANLTRSTGLSSSMIESAIGVSKAKNAPKVSTTVSQIDDGDNIYAVVLNSDTGEVINKQLLAKSAPTATEQKADNPTTPKVTKTDYTSWAKTDAAKGKTLDSMMAYYSGYLTPQEIYNIYKAQNYYKATPKETAAVQKKWGVK